MVIKYGSGTRYTPMQMGSQVFGNTRPATPDGPLNSSIGPSYFNIDLRVDKKVTKIGMGSKLEKLNISKLPLYIQKNQNKYTFNARYISSYDNFKSLSSRAKSLGGYSDKVDSSLMYDLGYQREIKNNDLNFSLNFSILNLTDEEAPKVNSQPDFSYDPRQIDPRGRIFSFGIDLNF